MKREIDVVDIFENRHVYFGKSATNISIAIQAVAAAGTAEVVRTSPAS